MDLSARIRAALEARGWSQTKLAEEADVSDEALSKILTHATTDPQLSTITRIAHALGETVSSLQGDQGYDLDHADQQRLRDFADWVYAKLGTATPPLADSAPNAVELHAVSDKRPSASPDAAIIPGLLQKKGATKVFRARGDSMIPAGILNDDLLFVRPAGVLRMAAGKIVVCTTKKKTFVKKLEMSQGLIRLVSADERYAPVQIARDEIEFIGIVVGRLGSFVS